MRHVTCAIAFAAALLSAGLAVCAEGEAPENEPGPKRRAHVLARIRGQPEMTEEEVDIISPRAGHGPDGDA